MASNCSISESPFEDARITVPSTVRPLWLISTASPVLYGVTSAIFSALSEASRQVDDAFTERVVERHHGLDDLHMVAGRHEFPEPHLGCWRLRFLSHVG